MPPPLPDTTTPPPIRTTPRPAPAALLLRTGIHAGIAIIIANALSPLLRTRPLGQHLVTITNCCYFVPWGLALSAGLNGDRLATITIALLITLTGWPDDLLTPGIAATTGFLTGLLLRTTLLGQDT